MKVLIVVAHPRKDSFTMSIAKHLISGIEASGNKYELLDLYKEKFNPALDLLRKPLYSKII
jgi:NAD(P)H dehydrogenase (quinone)